MDNSIATILWPPYLLDLNPIKHLWALLKRLLYERYPWIDDITKEAEAKAKLEEALTDCWNNLPQEYIDSLIDSIEKRRQAVEDAHGWWTRF